MIRVNTISLGLFGTNSYIVNLEDSTSLIIDPNDEKLASNIMIKPNAIILTHEHIDHFIGVSSILNKFGETPIFCSKETKNIITNKDSIIRQTRLIDYRLVNIYKDQIDKLNSLNIKEIKENDTIFNFKILETPGHSNGSICLYNPNEKIIFTGDLLFKNGYGRYDLEGGNFTLLKESLKRVLELEPSTIVYPGHGPSTQIKLEKQTLFF